MRAVELLRLAATFILVGIVVFVAVLWLTQRTFLYFPDDRPVPAAASVLAGAEDVVFTTEDGLALRGWLVPPRAPARGAFLVLSGNAGNRSDRAAIAEALSREGFSVLVFDYRGYGGNPGSPTEEGLGRDARAARAYLASRVDPASIVYLGESLGSAVAVALATESPPRALVLRSPFTSTADMARHHYPYLPIHPLILRDPYPSIDRIARVRAPILVIAGAADDVVPASFSRALYEAAPEPKRWVLIPGANHNAPALITGDAALAEVVRFAAEPPR